MHKGDRTRDAILDRALAEASVVGLEGLSIGKLAAELSLSKSGLFAHFGSKQELQYQVLARAVERNSAAVSGASRVWPGGSPSAHAMPMGNRCVDRVSASRTIGVDGVVIA